MKDTYLRRMEKHCQIIGIQLEVGRHNNIIHLYKIEVPANIRSNGYGRLILKKLCEYADRYGYIITLKPTDEYGSDYVRLCDFYRQFGFVFNTGSDKRDDIYEVMYRKGRVT